MEGCPRAEMAWGNPRRSAGANPRGDRDLVALAFEEVREWLSVSIMHCCLSGTDGMYNPLLVGAVNDVDNPAAGAMDCAPGVWLNPQRGSGNCLVRCVLRVRL